MKSSPKLKRAYKLMHEGCLALAEVESSGIRVDTRKLKETITSCEKEIKEKTDELMETKVAKIWQKRYGSNMNWDSQPQLVSILRDDLKLNLKVKHKGVEKETTDRRILEKVNHPFINGLLYLKKIKKARGTYLAGIEREVCNGYLHPSFPLCFAISYRSSSRNINFQNIPVRDPYVRKLIRSLFIPRDGHQLIDIDYKSLEVNIAACYHQDPAMIEYLTDPTKDMHRDMAMECYMLKQEQVSKDARYCAKNMFVFPQFYGDYYAQCAKSLFEAIKHHKLRTNAGLNLYKHLKAKGIRALGTCDPDIEPNPKKGTFERHIKDVEDDFWNERFPVYTKWKNDWYDKYLRKGYFDSFVGFRYAGTFDFNQVVNYAIQGSAFHCLLWSLIELNKRMRKRKMRSRIVGQIHDSIIGDVHESERDDYLQMIKRITTVELPKVWKWINVPLTIEAEVAPVGASWYEKEEYKI